MLKLQFFSPSGFLSKLTLSFERLLFPLICPNNFVPFFSISLHQETADDSDITLIVIRHLSSLWETFTFTSLLCTTGAKAVDVDLIGENVQIIMSHWFWMWKHLSSIQKSNLNRFFRLIPEAIRPYEFCVTMWQHEDRFIARTFPKRRFHLGNRKLENLNFDIVFRPVN